MTADRCNIICGKTHYHSGEHGAWTRKHQKGMCGYRPKIRPPNPEGGVYTVDGRRYRDYYTAKRAVGELMAPTYPRARTVKPPVCGSVAGYWGHRRRGEQQCRACLDAWAKHHREYKWGS